MKLEKVDVVIPVYRPDQNFLKLLRSLKRQTKKVHRIIIMNTEECYFDTFVTGTDFYQEFPDLLVKHVSKREFDHGATRNQGVKLSQTPYFLMMTQDALPVNDQLIEQLLAAFEQDHVAVAYARQLPAKDAGEIELFTREFNYPDQSRIKSKEDLPSLGIKTYFASDVCAMYDRNIFEKQGGFINHTIFNEDMIYAAGAVQRDYRIAYVAEAEVIHSHNYSGRQQLKRNFDLGVSQADHPDIFAGLPSEQEGKKLVKRTISHLWNLKKPYLIFKLIWQSGCKYLGYQLGKHYNWLPKAMIMQLTMSPEYWERS